jgi:hypothetical protein
MFLASEPVHWHFWSATLDRQAMVGSAVLRAEVLPNRAGR